MSKTTPNIEVITRLANAGHPLAIEIVDILTEYARSVLRNPRVRLWLAAERRRRPIITLEEVNHLLAK